MTSTSPLTSVSGLISGLDTSSIITQLMQIEAEPQTALKTTLTNTQSAITSYQDLNTKFQSLLTAAQNLTNPSTWGARTATSSDSSVAASATASALTGSVTFTVNQLRHRPVADQHRRRRPRCTDTSTFSLTGGSFSITGADGTATTITPADGSLQSVVSAINGSTAGVRAAAVQVAPGQYRLQLTGGQHRLRVDLHGQRAERPRRHHRRRRRAGREHPRRLRDPGLRRDVVDQHLQRRLARPDLHRLADAVSPRRSASATTPTASPRRSVKAWSTPPTRCSPTSPRRPRTAPCPRTARRAPGRARSPPTRRSRTSPPRCSRRSPAQSAVVSAAKFGIQSTQDGTLTFDADTFNAAYAADPAGAQALIAPVGGTGVAQRLAAVAPAGLRPGDRAPSPARSRVRTARSPSSTTRSPTGTSAWPRASRR